MTRAVRLVAAMLLAGASAPLAAQAQDDPVHLDDYAVSAAADNSLHVQQVSPGEDALRTAPQTPDRSLAAPEPGEPATATVPQLSVPGQAPEQAQLSKAGAAPNESAANVSSPTQSRPEGVQHLAGHDRCDPQLAAADLARCQHILELRAQEFHAPAPPQLSAEQKLLTEQRANEERTAGRSAESRLRLASRDDPDADLVSNQELASLYLGNQPPPPVQTPEREPAAADASLAQVLEALQISTAGAQGGAQ